jgi:hypothetical protein
MQRPSPGNRYTLGQIEKDFNRIIEALEPAKTAMAKMDSGGLKSVRVVKDAALGRCLNAAKAWSRSVEDGVDAETVGKPASESPEQEPEKRRKPKPTQAG